MNASPPSPPELSVIVFAYNEQANITVVLDELLTWLATHEPSSEVIVVDDGSSDGTVGAAEQALSDATHRVVSHDTNRGIGAALKTGVNQATGAWITFLPADGQVPPEAIGQLRAASHDADVVFSVYDNRDDGLKRKFLSWGVRALITAVHGVRIKSDGPYLFKRETFDVNLLKPDSFFLNFEFPIRTARAKTQSAVVTIECRPRISGASKSSGLNRIYRVGRDLIELRTRMRRE